MPALPRAPAPRAPAPRETPAQSGVEPGPAGTGTRLAWLDVLRGIAALMVVGDHLSWSLLNPLRVHLYHWIFPGYTGVCVFFLVSGYIIPASLERGGSLRSFWIRRMARLYPPYLVALGARFAGQAAGLWPPVPAVTDRPAGSAVGAATMLGELLGVPSVLPVAWTLAFEMAFYLLVAALYAAGRRRAGPVEALLLAGTALVLGRAMPALALSHAGRVIPAAAAAFLLALAGMLSGRRWLVTTGALLGGLLAAVLVLFNQNPVHRYDGLVIPALMFTGTTIYRVERRQISRWWAVVVPVAVTVAAVLEEWHGMDPAAAGYTQFRVRWLITLGTVAALFGAGLLLRRRRIPRPVVFLGIISYSVYLIHIPVLHVLVRGRSTAPLPVQALLYVAMLGAVTAVSAVMYRLVEAPAQRLGRALAARLE